MPSDRERREQYDSWRADGYPSLFDNLRGCGGCIWFIVGVVAVVWVVAYISSR